MTFADLKARDSLFLDARILVDHFMADAVFARRLHRTPVANREPDHSRFYFNRTFGP